MTACAFKLMQPSSSTEIGRFLFTNLMVKLLVGKALKEIIYVTVEETLLLPAVWDNITHYNSLHSFIISL